MSDEWMDLALCRSFANLPWLKDLQFITAAEKHAMTAVCTSCPVFDDCRFFVEDHLVSAGFWAGHDQSLYRHAAGGDAA